MEKFGPKNQNCQFKLNIDTSTNSNMENSTAVFTFLFSMRNALFGLIWSKMSKLSV